MAAPPETFQKGFVQHLSVLPLIALKCLCIASLRIQCIQFNQQKCDQFVLVSNQWSAANRIADFPIYHQFCCTKGPLKALPARSFLWPECSGTSEMRRSGKIKLTNIIILDYSNHYDTKYYKSMRVIVFIPIFILTCHEYCQQRFTTAQNN